MDKQAFYDAGVDCSHRWNTGDTDAVEQAQCFIDRYEDGVARLSPRDEIDALHAFATGYIDGIEGVASIPQTPALFYATNEQGDIVGVGVRQCSNDNQHVCSREDSDVARKLLDF